MLSGYRYRKVTVSPGRLCVCVCALNWPLGALMMSHVVMMIAGVPRQQLWQNSNVQEVRYLLYRGLLCV